MLRCSITRIRIVGDNVAAEAFRKYLARQHSNLPCTDKANRFSKKIESHKTIEKEVAFTNSIVSLVVFSDYGHHHPNRELCNRLRRVRRYTSHFDTELGSSVEVDIIKTCTSKYDIFLENIKNDNQSQLEREER